MNERPIGAHRVRKADENARELVAGLLRHLGCRLLASPESLFVKGEEGPATIVAAGARGRGLVRRALLGGVSTEVLRAARCPVLVCATSPGAAASGSAGMVVSAACA